MKARNVLIIIFLIFGLIGCEKTPQEVNNNINQNTSQSNYKEEHQIDDNLEYDTIDNILKTLDNVMSDSYSNITFEYNFDINKPGEIAQNKFIQVSNFNDNYLEVIKSFVGNSFDEKNIYWNDRLDPPGPQYDDKEKDIHFGMGNDGFYYYSHNEFLINISNGIYIEVERIPLRIEYEDHSYVLIDGEMKISEAIERAEVCAEELKSFSKDIELIPSEVIVYQTDDGYYVYNILFTKSYNNLYFSNYFYDYYSIKDKFIMALETEILIESKEKPGVIRNASGIIEYVETVKKYDEIITFECATKLVENLLSSYTKYKVQYVNLETKLKLLGKGENYDPTDYTAGNIYLSKPCWVFYLDLTPNKEVYVTVDLESGEVDFIKNNY